MRWGEADLDRIGRAFVCLRYTRGFFYQGLVAASRSVREMNDSEESSVAA